MITDTITATEALRWVLIIGGALALAAVALAQRGRIRSLEAERDRFCDVATEMMDEITAQDRTIADLRRMAATPPLAVVANDSYLSDRLPPWLFDTDPTAEGGDPR